MKNNDKCQRRIEISDMKPGVFFRFYPDGDSLYQVLATTDEMFDLVAVSVPLKSSEFLGKVRRNNFKRIVNMSRTEVLVNPGRVTMPLLDFDVILPGDILTTKSVKWGYYVFSVNKEEKSVHVAIVDPETGARTNDNWEHTAFRWGSNFSPEMLEWKIIKNSGLHPDRSTLKTRVYSGPDAEKATDFYNNPANTLKLHGTVTGRFDSSKANKSNEPRKLGNIFSDEQRETYAQYMERKAQTKRPETMDFGGTLFDLVDDMKYIAFEFVTDSGNVMTLIIDNPVYTAILDEYILFVTEDGQFHAVTKTFAHHFWEMKEEKFLENALHKQRIMTLLNSVEKHLRPVSDYYASPYNELW